MIKSFEHILTEITTVYSHLKTHLQNTVLQPKWNANAEYRHNISDMTDSTFPSQFLTLLLQVVV